MNPRLLYGFKGILLKPFAVLVIADKQSETPRPGHAHSDTGREHVKQSSYDDGELI